MESYLWHLLLQFSELLIGVVISRTHVNIPQSLQKPHPMMWWKYIRNEMYLILYFLIFVLQCTSCFIMLVCKGCIVQKLENMPWTWSDQRCLTLFKAKCILIDYFTDFVFWVTNWQYYCDIMQDYHHCLENKSQRPSNGLGMRYKWNSTSVQMNIYIP